MAQLPSKLQYDDLNGEEVLEIIHTRVYEYIHTLPELQRRFALTRCVLRLEIALDIWGASPPKKIFQHKLELLATDPLPPGVDETAVSHEEEIEIDSRNNPPDQIREEHGLAIPESARHAITGFRETVGKQSDEPAKYARPPQPRPTEQLPANQANPNERQIGRRRWAAWVDQDYGGSVLNGERNIAEPPVIGAQKIAEAGGNSTGDVAPVDPEFVVGTLETYGRITEDRGRAVVIRAIEKGSKVDETLAENQRIAEQQRQREQQIDEQRRQHQKPKPAQSIGTFPKEKTPLPKGRK